MKFIDSIVSAIRGAFTSEKGNNESSTRQADHLSISITYSSGSDFKPTISEDEVNAAVARHAFVFSKEVAELKTADEWFNTDTHKRRLRDNSEKAYAWIFPFVPSEVSLSETIKPKLEHGPSTAESIAKAIRAAIRDRRKAKQPYSELLSALYSVCIMDDFVNSLEFEGIPGRGMTRYVDLRLLQNVCIDYATIGYQCIDSLSKTDVKWLVDGFGEPVDHQSTEAYFRNIREEAISRYCWEELNRQNKSAVSLGIPVKSIEQWMRELVTRNIGYYKEWQHRVAARRELNEKVAVDIMASLSATDSPFVVADIETTGIDPSRSEILEMAAILVGRDGAIESEMSMLVRTNSPIPNEISQLTGITQAEVDSHGKPLPIVLSAFAEFIRERPVFFHNAPFDKSFISRYAALHRKSFDNAVHDTLPIARKAWPAIGAYRLGILAEHVGANAPEHRALGDAHAALAVLLAARAKLRER